MSTSAGTPSSQAGKYLLIMVLLGKPRGLYLACFVPSAGRATAGFEASVEFIVHGCATATSAPLTAVPGASLKFSHCCRACLLPGRTAFYCPAQWHARHDGQCGKQS